VTILILVLMESRDQKERKMAVGVFGLLMLSFELKFLAFV
jgi:hypothetical protein